MKNEMPLREQVGTLKQAKKLAELLKGVENPPESFWMWSEREDGEPPDLLPRSTFETWHKPLRAYTGDEAGALLPKFLNLETHECYLDLWGTYSGFACCYRNTEDECPMSGTFDSPFGAHIKNDLLIHILEHKCVEPEELSYKKLI